MTLAVNGATRLHIIVGDPIVQVQSPAGMTKTFAEHGHNAVLLPVHVSPADLMEVLKAADRIQNLDGIVVTIPHKFACYKFCTSATDRAHLLGAVNVLRRAPGGGWFGDMLDGIGFVGAIRANGCKPEGKRALMVGAGGAGSAIAMALIEAGVRELAIHDSDTQRRDALIGKLMAKLKAPVMIGSADPIGFDVIANASPAGMKPGDPYPVDPARLTPDMFVGCVITAPAVSPIVEAARKIGCKTSVGREMYLAEQKIMLDFLTGGATA